MEKTYSFPERIENGKIGGDKGTVSQDHEIFKARIAKTHYRKFERDIPSPNFREEFIYSQDRSAYSAVDRF
jgi:hypothetical protein